MAEAFISFAALHLYTVPYLVVGKLKLGRVVIHIRDPGRSQIETRVGTKWVQQAILFGKYVKILSNLSDVAMPALE